MNMDIFERDEKVDELYGLEEFELCEEEVRALLAGKKLYATINDEYAITIVVEGK